MTGRLGPSQLKKYDVTQRMMEMLADAEARTILFSMVKKAKTATDLSYDLRIPLSSVYKKLGGLEELTLVEVKKTLRTDKGRKFKVYRSRISKADISIKKPEPTLRLVPN